MAKKYLSSEPASIYRLLFEILVIDRGNPPVFSFLINFNVTMLQFYYLVPDAKKAAPITPHFYITDTGFFSKIRNRIISS